MSQEKASRPLRKRVNQCRMFALSFGGYSTFVVSKSGISGNFRTQYFEYTSIGYPIITYRGQWATIGSNLGTTNSTGQVSPLLTAQGGSLITCPLDPVYRKFWTH